MPGPTQPGQALLPAILGVQWNLLWGRVTLAVCGAVGWQLPFMEGERERGSWNLLRDPGGWTWVSTQHLQPGGYATLSLGLNPAPCSEE